MKLAAAIWLTVLAIYAVERLRPEPGGLSILSVNVCKPGQKSPKFWNHV